MDLVIALEMSRLQMIEDEMKKRQRAAEDSSKPSLLQLMPGGDGLAGTSVGSSTTQEGTDDQQLKLAIQLSLQETAKKASKSLNSNTGATEIACDPHDEGTSDQADMNVLELDEEMLEKNTSVYHKTPADLTVDYFLKSLAGRQIDLKNFNTGMNVFSPDDGEDMGEMIWGCGVSKTLADKELIGCGFKPCVAEDGRFEISDIHENGCFNDIDEYDETDSRLLKRSHSTGDLCTRGRRGPRHGVGTGGEEPRYHLDSDHSTQHEEKPEDIVKRILAFPAASGKALAGRQFLLLHHHSSSNAGGETSMATSEDGASIYFGGQSSVEDTTTTSDSLNADLEVCGILGTTTEDDEEGKGFLEDDNGTSSVKQAEVIASDKKLHTDFGLDSSLVIIKEICRSNEKSHSCSNVASTSLASASGKSSTGSSLLEAHRKAFKAAGGKAAGSSGLRIRICKSPNASSSGVTDSGRQLETDSSNEYESETGIPKSPTLFISGVSISRTPEPRSPALVVAAAAAAAASVAGRQSRSSSLTVPPPPPLAPPLTSTVLTSSSASLNATAATLSSSPEPQTPLLVKSSTPVNFTSSCTASSGNSLVITPPPLLPLIPPPSSPVSSTASRSGAPSPVLTPGNSATTVPSSSGPTNQTKSKSATEPERQREMFHFPKSSTDGALSSVLPIQERNLSSDDFHEALFLLERSPKGSGSSKRRN